MIGDMISQLPPELQLLVGPQAALLPIVGAILLTAFVLRFAEDIEVVIRKYRKTRKQKRDINRLYHK